MESRRSVRPQLKSEDQLEFELDQLSDSLHDLFIASDQMSEQNSVEEVRELSNRIRGINNTYKVTVQELATLKGRLGRIHERETVLTASKGIKTLYHEKMTLLRTVRVRLHDDNISEITCSSDLTQEISPSEKCSYFVEEQTFNGTQVSNQVFSTPPNEVNLNQGIVLPHVSVNLESTSLPVSIQNLNPSMPPPVINFSTPQSNYPFSTNAPAFNSAFRPLHTQSNMRGITFSRPIDSNIPQHLFTSTPRLVHQENIAPPLNRGQSYPRIQPEKSTVQFQSPLTEYHIYDNTHSPNLFKNPVQRGLVSNSTFQQHPTLSSVHNPSPCYNAVHTSDYGAIPKHSFSQTAPVFSNPTPSVTHQPNALSHSMNDMLARANQSAPTDFMRLQTAPMIPEPLMSSGHDQPLPSSLQNIPPTSSLASIPLNSNRFTRHLRPLAFNLHFNPLLPANNPPPHGVIQDGTARLLIKTQLCNGQDTTNVYKGEASKFAAFIEKLRCKISNLELDHYEIIEVIKANCEGRAKETVSLFEFSAFLNGEEALNELWKEMYSNFGHPKHVRSEINQRLRKVGDISSKENVLKLKELLQVCNLISVNMRGESDNLAIFDSEDGQSQIFNLFPPDLFNKWRRIVTPYEGNCPKFCKLLDFIRGVVREVTSLEYKGAKRPNHNVKSYYVASNESESNVSKYYPDCEKYCMRHNSLSHNLYDCKEFLAEHVKERVNYIKSNRLCYRCFKPHKYGACNYVPRCEICSNRHQTSLHDSEFIQNILKKQSETRVNHANRNNVNVSSSNITYSRSQNVSSQQPEATSLWGSTTGQEGHSYSKVLLVNVSSIDTGKSVKCYGILDEQSSKSFISPSLADQLGVTGTDVDYSLNTMNGLKSFTCGKRVTGLRIRGVNEMRSYSLPPVVTNQFIPNCIEEVATPEVVDSHPQVKRFSKFFPPRDDSVSVMILLGRDTEDLMNTNCLTNKAPFVHKTNLGYALVGSTDKSNFKSNFNVFKTAEHFQMVEMVPVPTIEFLSDRDACNSLRRLPDDELQGKSRENIRFDSIMESGTHINGSSNVEMPLPFQNEDQLMPDNRKPVYMRTKNTLSRLALDPAKLEQCRQTMGKYIAANHVEPIPRGQEDPEDGKGWWLPVFPVTQAKKSKTRLVFDSSASYKGVSLNDVLLQGADRNNNLRGVLMRFRNGPVAVSSDIEAMFHSFYLTEKHRDFVRFYWFKDNDPSKSLIQYRAKVHIFGNKPSPAIANHGLRCAINYETDDDCTELSKSFVLRNIYVDDALAAFENSQVAIETLEGAKNKLEKFQIRLHKIASNSKQVLQYFPESELAEACTNNIDVCGALGLQWNFEEDVLKFDVDIPKKDFTPRGILSVNHSIFDPLGLIAPVILKGKLIQREMFSARQSCTKGVSDRWDVPLGEEFFDIWEEYKHSLDDIRLIEFQRGYYPEELVPVTLQELHVFADASFDGLGYCVFLRSFGNNSIHVSLVCAGSKLTPRAATSVPRLELNGAMEASVAALRVREELNISSDKVFYYSDSKVVLGYLSNSVKRFTRYVSRRVETISNMCCNNRWLYINTEENPADIASRPQTIDILKSRLWLHGPPFLSDGRYLQDDFESDLSCIELPEENIILNTFKSEVEKRDGVFEKVTRDLSSFRKVINVSKYVLSLFNLADRAKQRLGVSLCPRPGYNDVCENEALATLLRNVQSPINVQRLVSFSPFLDNFGLWRVGGRLKHACLPIDGRNPVIVLRDSGLGRLLVEHYHRVMNHSGRQLTLSSIRSAGYFIEGGRTLVNSVISACVICRKLRYQPCIPKMADLPKDRLEESPPFTSTGVDMFGPFAVTEGITTRRNPSTKKVWGLLLICMVTRAVHIETVPGLDTSSMRNALRRFFALRGVCKHLRSDNGTNFVATCKQIDAQKCLTDLKSEANRHDCTWSFNAPGASHMGGSWERAIGSIRKVMGSSLLHIGKRAISKDELSTLFQEAAAIVNNTPLYQVSYHPDEPLPITPAHLLTLKDAPNPPPIEYFTEKDVDCYGMNRWKRIQYISDEFWRRWRKEYLATLQARSKWTKERTNLRVGDLVLIKDKNLARNDWRTGILNEVFLSNDGVVRTCEVKTPRGIYKRAVCDLVLLIPAECGVSRIDRE